jgi:hypothetical protein
LGVDRQPVRTPGIGGHGYEGALPGQPPLGVVVEHGDPLRGRVVFYSGSMAYDKRPGAGALHRLAPDGSASVILTGVTISNGLEPSADGTRAYCNGVERGFALEDADGTVTNLPALWDDPWDTHERGRLRSRRRQPAT